MQQLDANHIDRLNRYDAQSKQNSRGLTSLAFAQLDPGRLRGPPYLHSVYSCKQIQAINICHFTAKALAIHHGMEQRERLVENST